MTEHHDPLCEWSSLAPPLTPCRQCDLIARVRADERERWLMSDHVMRSVEVSESYGREMALADLWAKVAGLLMYPGDRWNVADVLALFDEATP